MLSYTGYSNNGNPAYSNGFITGSPSVWIKNCILTCIWEDVCHSGSVQFRHSVVSNSLWPDGLLHVRPPRPSPTPGFTQNHVHWVGDVMQPSHPLLSNSPPTINLSQHQGLFKWVSYLHQVAKVLEFQLQHQSFQWIFRTDFL